MKSMDIKSRSKGYVSGNTRKKYESVSYDDSVSAVERSLGYGSTTNVKKTMMDKFFENSGMESARVDAKHNDTPTPPATDRAPAPKQISEETIDKCEKIAENYDNEKEMKRLESLFNKAVGKGSVIKRDDCLKLFKYAYSLGKKYSV